MAGLATLFSNERWKKVPASAAAPAAEASNKRPLEEEMKKVFEDRVRLGQNGQTDDLVRGQ